MKAVREFVVSTLVGGIFIVVPVYLAIVLLLKGMQSAARLVKPFAAMLPDWLPAESFFSLLLVLLVCFVVGAAVRTRTGRAIREKMEKVFFERLPGYGLLRSLTQRLAGDTEESAWQPALAEIEEALVPCLHHRRTGGRAVHGVRALHPDTICRRRLRPCRRARASRRRAVHPGGQDHLAVGVGRGRPGGRHEERAVRRRRSGSCRYGTRADAPMSGTVAVVMSCR